MTNKKPLTCNTVSVELAIIQTKMDAMKIELHEVKDKLSDKYVTTDQFEPIKKIVYGMVALIMVTVVAAIITGVLK